MMETFNIYRIVIGLCCLMIIQQVATVRSENNQDYEFGMASSRQYKFGEFNDKCKMTRDCRHFGYVCRENKTCQCDFMYVPSADKKTCVGGVNQRCVYDEHCIQGAFCMNQSVCRCKDSSPIELDDGLVCSDGQMVQSITKLLFLLTTLLIL